MPPFLIYKTDRNICFLWDVSGGKSEIFFRICTLNSILFKHSHFAKSCLNRVQSLTNYVSWTRWRNWEKRSYYWCLHIFPLQLMSKEAECAFVSYKVFPIPSNGAGGGAFTPPLLECSEVLEMPGSYILPASKWKSSWHITPETSSSWLNSLQRTRGFASRQEEAEETWTTMAWCS